MGNLSDLNVVEVSQAVAGPFAGKLLGDLGATVVKIEQPGVGDQQRYPTEGTIAVGNFPFLNHDKQCLSLDLTDENGKEIFHDLLSDADVLIENFSPGQFDRFGLSIENLLDQYDDLIALSIKAFGDGPFESRIGTDYPIELESSMAYMNGIDGEPLRCGFSVVDLSAAMFGVIGIQSLLLNRPTAAEDRSIEVGLFETAVMMMGQSMSFASQEEQNPTPLNVGGGHRAVYHIFNTKDSGKVFIGIWNDRHWERFINILNIPELSKYDSEEKRMENQKEIHEQIQDALLEFDSDELVKMLSSERLLFAKLQKPLEILDNHHLIEGDKFVNIGDESDITIPKPPIEGNQFDFDYPNSFLADLGQHNDSILEELGYSAQEIQDLRDSGVID